MYTAQNYVAVVFAWKELAFCRKEDEKLRKASQSANPCGTVQPRSFKSGHAYAMRKRDGLFMARADPSQLKDIYQVHLLEIRKSRRVGGK